MRGRRARGLLPRRSGADDVDRAEWFPYPPLPKLPAIFGLDSAGLVTAVGDQVRTISVGDRIYVNPDWVRERTGGEGVDIVIDALGPGAPADAMLEAIDSLARGGFLVDIGGIMERSGLDLFAMMCSQRSVLGSLWFSTRDGHYMADMVGRGALDLSVLEHHTFPLAGQRGTRHHPEAARRIHQLRLRALRTDSPEANGAIADLRRFPARDRLTRQQPPAG